MIFNESNMIYYNILFIVFLGELGIMVESWFFKWLCIVVYSVICFIGVLGNLLVIFVSCKLGMIIVSNVFIVNFGLVDFVVFFINMFIVVIYSYLVYWLFGVVFCKFVLFL